MSDPSAVITFLIKEIENKNKIIEQLTREIEELRRNSVPKESEKRYVSPLSAGADKTAILTKLEQELTKEKNEEIENSIQKSIAHILKYAELNK